MAQICGFFPSGRPEERRADGQGATGGRGGNDASGAAGGNGGLGGNGAAGGIGGPGDGGGLYVGGGTITVIGGTIDGNQALGGACGTGSAGGQGGLGARGGRGGGEFVFAGGSSVTTTYFGFPARVVGGNGGGNGGTGAPGGTGGNGANGGAEGNGGDGGNGANGGNGGNAAGGGLYVSAGSVTVIGTAFANNPAAGGQGGGSPRPALGEASRPPTGPRAAARPAQVVSAIATALVFMGAIGPRPGPLVKPAPWAMRVRPVGRAPLQAPRAAIARTRIRVESTSPAVR
jgi:hypothetical protein